MVTSKEISKDILEYLTVANPRAGQFCLIPKIHKPGNPGRPDVSVSRHPTEPISECVDLHLKPFVSELPSYVYNTTDYLTKLSSSDISEETLLVSLELVSLYTNIPHDDRGMQGRVEH